MPAIGFVSYDPEKDTYQGEIKTISIQCPITFEPRRNKTSDKQPDYTVVSGRVEVGAAWKKTSQSDTEYVSLYIAAPEFGRRKLYANLGKAAGQDDDSVFAIIWNTEDD